MVQYENMGIRNLRHWIKDYFHLARLYGHTIFVRKPPKHYLGHIVMHKAPIILIPGVTTKWTFLKIIADPLSLQGHPIYVIEKLGYNMKDIPTSATLVRDVINEYDLKDVVIIAHSKGGLIGKYALLFNNADARIKKMVAIATPFGGSEVANFIPHQAIRELSPKDGIIQKLNVAKEVNGKITSIYGLFDNHVWPVESCRLEGAKNIQVAVHGHHAILVDPKVRDVVISEVEKM